MVNSMMRQFFDAQARAASQNTHVAALVKVTAFYPDKMLVDVQPVSKWLDNGQYQSQPPILSVPVAPTRCGGFILRPWYKPGDLGAVLYLDHDMDKALEAGDECEPNTERCHSASDAVFVGGVVPGSAAIGDIPEGLAVAKEDGSIYIVIADGKIKILGDAEWKGNIDITGEVRITGELYVNGIAFTPHTHGQVKAGTDNSGPPNP